MKNLYYLTSFLIALAGGQLASWLGLPIPWLLGSLLAVGLSNLAGLPIYTHEASRKFGLMVIGISLGLYFSPQMIGLMSRYAYLLLAVAVFGVLLGGVGSLLMYRIGRVDFKTAWFASVIGGASEMSNLAKIHNARVDLVVAAHTWRMFLVVTCVPFFYQFMNYHGDDGLLLSTNPAVHWSGLLLLLLISLLVAKVFEYKHLSNPWTFAPLLTAAVLTANDVHLSAMPNWLSQLGQVCIGWTLGGKFRPDFFRTAPRLILATSISTALHLSLTALLSLLLTRFTGIDVAILGLGFAPGGVAEMTITAKTLQLGVPMVTMLHITRMLIVIGTAGVLYHWLNRLFFSHRN